MRFAGRFRISLSSEYVKLRIAAGIVQKSCVKSGYIQATAKERIRAKKHIT
jgi:hypothetical protein